MSKTKFCHFMFYLMVLTLIWILPEKLSAKVYTLADLCETKTITVHVGDQVQTNFSTGQCVDKFNSKVGPDQYHCESVTKIKPDAPGQQVSINFLQNYIIGYPNDNPKLVTGRLMVLNGIHDVPMTSTSCSGTGTLSKMDMGGAKVLFDSYINGSKFSNLNMTTITSTAADGGLTVVVLLLSTDLGSFPFSIAMSTTPNTTCQLSCLSKVNISLDTRCGRRITPYDVDLTCTAAPGVNRYGIMISYPTPSLRQEYGPDSVGVKLIGHELVYKLIDSVTQNSCWGHIKIEDKAPPVVTSRNDTIPCLDASYAERMLSIQTDGCAAVYNAGPSVKFISLRFEDYSCTQNANYTGRVIRHYRVSDLWNNTGDYHDTIYIKRLVITPASFICPPKDTMVDCSKTVDLDGDKIYEDILWSKLFYTGADGYQHPYPTKGPDAWGGNNSAECREAFPAPGIRYVHYVRANPTDLVPTVPRDTVVYMIDPLQSGGKCNITWKYDDMVIPLCGAGYKIRRTWEVYDWCNKVDTQCVQWIKITDTVPPVVEGEDHLAVVKDVWTCTNINRSQSCEYKMVRDDRHTECDHIDDGNCPSCITIPQPGDVRLHYVFKDDNKNYEQDEDEYLILHDIGHATTDPHECSAHINFPDFKSWLTTTSCEKIVKVFYTVEYNDPSHPGKIITQHGEVTPAKFIYLPAGWHYVLITFRDDCWNESYYWWRVAVHDATPPTPVCDAHTVVTLNDDDKLDPNDAKYCWARVYAKDLDDGSHDNCCEDLHFAVAQMDSIEHWTTHWENYFHACLGETAFYAHKKEIDTLISAWIDCFVFAEYLDVTDCGTENLVLRVYEKCGAPHYDPHLFKGTEHQWLCYNLYDDYACWYAWNFDQYATGYANPRPNLYCNYTSGFKYGWEVPYLVYPDYICHSEDQAWEEHPNGHGPWHNLVSCSFESEICDPTEGHINYKNWKARVSEVDRNIINGLSEQRYWFPHLSNDCMIDLEKQDKIAPICTVPADVTLYCDGTPYSGTIIYGKDKITYVGADDAWLFCDRSDKERSDCPLDNSTANTYSTGINGSTDGDKTLEWCYKSGPVNDQYGRYQGYYGAQPGHGDETTCPAYGDHFYKPIYCRLWLLLDQFEDSTGARIDPTDYFADDEDVIVKECSGYDIDHEDSGVLNECGVGTLTRTWTIVEKCVPNSRTYCYQKVEVKGRSDFEVCFPKDIVIECEDADDILPEALDEEFGKYSGTPKITDDDCELIGIHYEDEEFTLEIGIEGACRKVVRTWTIIDWCVYNPDALHHAPDIILDDRENAGLDRECVIRCLKDDGDGYVTYRQIIKIIDLNAPVLTCPTDKEICNTSGDCLAEAISLPLGSARDGCTPDDELRYRYLIEHTETSEYHAGNGNVFNGTLGFGHHIVTLIASDRCGNEDTCSFLVEIRDCKLPTPYCLRGVATVLMPSSGSVEVWAKDLDANSFDNCTDQEDLRFTFDAAGLEPSRTFTCANIPNGIEARLNVDIYVWDEADNVDFCRTTILLQDGAGNICPNASPGQFTDTQSGLQSNAIVTANGTKSTLVDDHTVYIRSDQDELQEISVEDGRVMLYQNQPNPFNAETSIMFYLEDKQQITLRILDLQGKQIWRTQGQFDRGLHTVKVNEVLKGIQGMLFYELQTSEVNYLRKMIRTN